MIYSDEARQRIIDHLKIKPINHGQVHVSQVVIPKALTESLDEARVKIAVESLKRFGSNLYPILLRKTDLYGEDREYEVIFGEEWCEAATRLGLEKIWVWIFDIADDQIANTRQFMSLEGKSLSPDHATGISTASSISLEDFRQSLLGEISKEISKLRKEIEDKLNQVLSRLPEPLQLKNINDETEAGLSSLKNRRVKENARKIYRFIQEQNGITSLDQLKAIKGIGDKTIAFLKGIYKCEKKA